MPLAPAYLLGVAAYESVSICISASMITQVDKPLMIMKKKCVSLTSYTCSERDSPGLSGNRKLMVMCMMYGSSK